MTTENEMKPAAPAEALDGGRCAVDAGSVSGIRCEGWEGPCDSINAKRRRQNTRYVDEERNYVTLCDDCMKLNHEYWEEMWADYYSNCM